MTEPAALDLAAGRRRRANAPASLVERLWRNFERDPVSRCWNWTGAKCGPGYGVLTVSGRSAGAHRAMYETLVEPIGEGVELDHLCRNRGCVNPVHLEPVTGRTNTLRGNGPGGVNARKTHCNNGHEFTPENTARHMVRGVDRGRVCLFCRRANRARRTARARVARLA